jgi:hypothetical protein
MKNPYCKLGYPWYCKKCQLCHVYRIYKKEAPP